MLEVTDSFWLPKAFEFTCLILTPSDSDPNVSLFALFLGGGGGGGGGAPLLDALAADAPAAKL